MGFWIGEMLIWNPFFYGFMTAAHGTLKDFFLAIYLHILGKYGFMWVGWYLFRVRGFLNYLGRFSTDV